MREGRSCTFRCIDIVVLKRLPPIIRDALPWDWNWPFVDTFLAKSITDDVQYDTIRRQGLSNMVDKLLIRGSKAFEQFQTRYYTHAQLWFAELEAEVRDTKWQSYSPSEQSERQWRHDEYEYFKDKEDKVTLQPSPTARPAMPCLAPCSMCAHPDPCTSHADTPHIQVVQLASRLSSEHFTLHSLTAKTMTEKLLSVCEASPLPSSPLLLSGSREVPSISSKRRISDLSDESDPDEDGSLSPISQRQQSMLAEERIAAQEAAVASLAAREHPQSGAAASSSGAVVAPACAASSSGATIVVPPVQLHQASQSSTKRSKHGQNKWLCICSDPDAARARGQPWHHSQCPRKRWTDGDAGLTSDPIVGQVVQLIASDRMPSAKVGWKYQYTGRKAPHGPWIRTA